jgi:hypothetical protein
VQDKQRAVLARRDALLSLLAQAQDTWEGLCRQERSVRQRLGLPPAPLDAFAAAAAAGGEPGGRAAANATPFLPPSSAVGGSGGGAAAAAARVRELQELAQQAEQRIAARLRRLETGGYYGEAAAPSAAFAALQALLGQPPPQAPALPAAAAGRPAAGRPQPKQLLGPEQPVSLAQALKRQQGQHAAAAAAAGDPAAEGPGLSAFDLPRSLHYYKTRPCQAWHTVGACSRGDACTYAHGAEELRAPGQSGSAAAAAAAAAAADAAAARAVAAAQASAKAAKKQARAIRRQDEDKDALGGAAAVGSAKDKAKARAVARAAELSGSDASRAGSPAPTAPREAVPPGASAPTLTKLAESVTPR